MRINYFLPLLLGTAFLALGLALPSMLPNMSAAWQYSLLALGCVLLVVSYFVAKNGSTTPQTRGGDAGSSTASGDYSEADGGAGGKANGGVGGRGGNALASGKGARAKGGAGGSG